MAFAKTNGHTYTGGRYDRRHQQARAAAARTHQPTDPCTRCGHPLGPMGRWLHYDHDDNDRSGNTYNGFAHARCNTRAGARLGRERQTGNPRTTRGWHSTSWTP